MTLVGEDLLAGKWGAFGVQPMLAAANVDLDAPSLIQRWCCNVAK